MRKYLPPLSLVLYVTVLLALPIGGRASSLYPTLNRFVGAVRNQTQIYSTSLLADTVARELSRSAIISVSTDFRGVEKRVKITTVNGQAFYQLPDSVVKIISGTVIAGKLTRSIKAWNPPYFEDFYNLTQLGGATTTGNDPDAIPKAYYYWADTLQLLPIPVKTDSIYLSCYIRHSPMVTASDTLMRLKSGYDEAAIYLACHKVLLSLQMYEEAATYYGYYEKKAAQLTAKYKRDMDVLPNQETKK